MRPFRAFAVAGNWFKGNCHTHTTLSDGTLGPEETLTAYGKLGYDFVALTEHRKTYDDVTPYNGHGPLVIPGVELHPATKKPAPGPHHIVGLGIERVPAEKVTSRWTVRKTIRWIEEQGGIPIYAHPYWTGHDLDHMLEGKKAFGVEAYNHASHTTRGLGDSSVHYDHILSQGVRWRAFAVDDTHIVDRDAGGGWIMVKAKSCTVKSILRAIRLGHFYASSGPEIHHVSLKRNVLRVECSPVQSVVWHGYGPFGIAHHAKAKPLTCVETPLTPQMLNDTGHLRLELIDGHGGKAWSNPIYRDGKTGRWVDE